MGSSISVTSSTDQSIQAIVSMAGELAKAMDNISLAFSEQRPGIRRSASP